MDYRKHTKQRFEERLLPIIKSKKINKFWKDYINKQWLCFDDADYDNICDISNNDYVFKENQKVIIKYKEMFMWVVLSKKSKIVKTIFPISRSDMRKYVKIM